VLMTPRTL